MYITFVMHIANLNEMKWHYFDLSWHNNISNLQIRFYPLLPIRTVSLKTQIKARSEWARL